VTAAAQQVESVASERDVLAVAREQVLERGVGLDEGQVLRVLRLPSGRLLELLGLAHEVRMQALDAGLAP
jgi:biotin synthase